MFAVIFLLTIPARVFVNGQFAQTAAVCSSEYAWMGNTRGVSPCQVASSLNALCNNGNWNIPQLNGSNHYTPPDSSGTASLCTCSWASYNLISACTACQNQPEWISFWSDYSSQCTGKLSGSYWPASITISTEILIPYWASNDPTKWTSQKFNPSEAKQIQQSGHADLASSSPSKEKSTPVGAIAGGVVGGLVVLAVFIVLAICILRRYRSPTEPLFLDGPNSQPAHMRKISDTTVTSGMTTSGASTFTSVLPGMFRNHNTNAAARMHNSSVSVSSLPFFSSGIAGEHQSSAPRRNGTPTRPEGAVTPFTLPPTNENPDKKQSNGEWPVFNSTNASPNLARMEVIPSLNSTRRERYNPPAYSESVSGTTAPGSLHRVQDSMDSTNYSVPESTVNGGSSIRRTHTPMNSDSSMGHTVVVSSPLNTSFGTDSSSQDLGVSISERSWNPRRQESFHASDIA